MAAGPRVHNRCRCHPATGGYAKLATFILADDAMRRAATSGKARAEAAAATIADLVWRRATVRRAYFARFTASTVADRPTRWAAATANHFCVAFTGTMMESLPPARLVGTGKTREAVLAATSRVNQRHKVGTNEVEERLMRVMHPGLRKLDQIVHRKRRVQGFAGLANAPDRAVVAVGFVQRRLCAESRQTHGITFDIRTCAICRSALHTSQWARSIFVDV